jgi:hypothetical protein
MAWFSPTFTRRAWITVDLPGTSPVDVDVAIPKDWDRFWGTIDSAGNELRPVWYDGATVLTYDVDDGSGGAFSVANRNGRIRIDGMVVPTTAAMLAIPLYYGTTSNVGDGSSAVTITSARTGYIELGRPGQHRLAHRAQPVRSGKPRDIIQKTVNEQKYVWIRYDHVLGRRISPGRGGNRHEEPLYATIQVHDNAAADQSSMYTATALRWVETPSGQLWLRTLVKAGTNDTNYTGVVLTRTIQPGDTSATQQLETRFGISVLNTLE